MAVKDFMTRKVVYISPDTTIAHAAELMKEQEIHRLPVIENDKLVGLVTEGTIAEASPSKATSLSIYEMNYLLNKTKVKDVMLKNVITISRFASLEDAAYLMYKHKIGILPVEDNGQLYGVITDRDVLSAFLHVSAYGQAGLRLRFLVDDGIGVLARIVTLIAEQNYNILSTVQIQDKSEKEVIEIQLDSGADRAVLEKVFADAGIPVDSIMVTEAKKI